MDPPQTIRVRFEFAAGDDVIPRGTTAHLDDRRHFYTFDLPPDGDGCVPSATVDFVTRSWRMFEPAGAPVTDAPQR